MRSVVQTGVSNPWAEGPCVKEAGEPLEFVRWQFRTGAAGLWLAAQAILSAQSVPGSPSLDRLFADAQGARDPGDGFSALQASHGRKTARLQFFCIAALIT